MKTQFVQARCAGGWALAWGPKEATGPIGVFSESKGKWKMVKGVYPTDGSPAPAGLAETGIPVRVLEDIASEAAVSVRRLAEAGALVEPVAAHEEVLKNGSGDGYQASDVLAARGGFWFVLAGLDSADSSDMGTRGQPYPNATVRVYRWSERGWSLEGTTDGFIGPVTPSCCGIEAQSVTGSQDPDFSLAGGGAADTNWLSVVSDIGGAWHLVPFDYGYTATTVVNGYPEHSGIATEVDACSCASGPTTTLFETYQSGEFRPDVPPGDQPRCEVDWLSGDTTEPEGSFPPVDFSDIACADGWALAVGSGPGFTGRVVGLFQSDKALWRIVTIDNGEGLGSAPATYDIPPSLIAQLANHFGPALQAEAAVAPLIAKVLGPWSASWTSGVMAVGDAKWFVLEAPLDSSPRPAANATIYRWSGAAWIVEGSVPRVPAALDAFTASGTFQPVAVRGTADPGFVLQDGSSRTTSGLTDAGGKWHTALIPPGG